MPDFNLASFYLSCYGISSGTVYFATAYNSNMIDLQPPSIESAIFLMRFSEPYIDVKFEQKAAERAFRDIVNAPSQQTNALDGAPPHAARIVFQEERKAISISQAACQLDLSFDGSDETVGQQFETIEKNVSQFSNRARQEFSVAPYGMTALIINVTQKSSNTDIELQKYLYERFIKVPPVADVVSAQATVGFKIDNFFANLSVGAYEARQLEVAGLPGTSVHIDLERIPVQSRGLSFRVDINDRPHVSKMHEPSDINIFLETVKAFLKNHYGQLVGESLL